MSVRYALWLQPNPNPSLLPIEILTLPQTVNGRAGPYLPYECHVRR